MDNFETNQIPHSENVDKPIPFDSGAETDVSHSPLNLGVDSSVPTPSVSKTAPVTGKPAEKTGTAVSSDRIIGVRIFFTKLHPGAIEFLSEQITKWLSDNPGIVIKRTNMVTGNIQSKKLDPNLIVTVWY